MMEETSKEFSSEEAYFTAFISVALVSVSTVGDKDLEGAALGIISSNGFHKT